MRKEDLSPMLLVSLELYKAELNGKKLVLSELKEKLPDINVKTAVENCIDLGSVYANWREISNDLYELEYFIYKDETKIFLQKILLELGEIEIKVK